LSLNYIKVIIKHLAWHIILSEGIRVLYAFIYTKLYLSPFNTFSLLSFNYLYNIKVALYIKIPYNSSSPITLKSYKEILISALSKLSLINVIKLKVINYLSIILIFNSVNF
jgi:hypothetical protein